MTDHGTAQSFGVSTARPAGSCRWRESVDSNGTTVPSEDVKCLTFGVDFPYRQLLTHPSWAVLEKAIEELELNNDLELHTASRYIVGFLIQQLTTAK